LVARLCQFILAACFFVGRTDVPFLSADVSMFGYIFDYAPQSFVKDILVHEAHHHPYIERLFAMYMMKLKSDEFCSDAGACWRQLFVAALMPWLVKLRVFSDERLGDKVDEYNARRREGQLPLQIRQLAEMKHTVTSVQTSQGGEEAGVSAQADSSAPSIGKTLPKTSLRRKSSAASSSSRKSATNSSSKRRSSARSVREDPVDSSEGVCNVM
jgi:hypothetical protein